MGNALKGLTMAAGIFITCIVISFSLLVLREGKQMASGFLREMREEERLYRENKWTRYDGSVVSGAEVIHCIRRFQDELLIYVNNRITENEYSSSRSFSLSENLSDLPSYIEPFDDYEGKVERKQGGEIYRIRFTKRG